MNGRYDRVRRRLSNLNRNALADLDASIHRSASISSKIASTRDRLSRGEISNDEFLEEIEDL